MSMYRLLCSALLLVVVAGVCVAADAKQSVELDIAVEPIPLPDYYMKDWGLSAKPTPAEYLGNLPDHMVSTTAYKLTADGKLQFLVGSFEANGEHLRLIQTYMNYVPIQIGSAWYRCGVGLRIAADFYNVKGKISLSSVFSASASAGVSSGHLTFEAVGITGPDVADFVPAPSDLTPQTLSEAAAAVAVLKSKMYAQNTIVKPVLLCKCDRSVVDLQTGVTDKDGDLNKPEPITFEGGGPAMLRLQ